MKRSELEIVLEGLIALRARTHCYQISAELKTGQPQYSVNGVLEKIDQTINLLTKEINATQDRTPKTLAQKFNMFVGFKL